MKTGWVFLASPAILSGLLGCSDTMPDGPYSVRDSSGVTLVESQGPAWDAGTGWALSTEPSLQIGKRAGEDPFQFYEVSDGLRLPDGRIVILNSGTETIRVFSADGEFLTEFGGRGDGPGEFRSARSLHHLGGDTLLVWDSGRPGFSLFDASGAFLRSATLSQPGTERFSTLHPCSDGRLILTTYASPVTNGGDRGVGIYRDVAPVLVFDRNGILLDTLGTYPSTETMIVQIGSGTGVGPSPFPKSTFLAVNDRAVNDRHVHLGTADRMDVSILNLHGDLQEVFRVPNVDLTVREEDREWYRARMREMASTPEEEQMLGVLLPRLIFPETRAAYSDLAVDPAGATWLRTGRHFPPFAPSGEWTVLADGGFLLGRVQFPERFEPMDIGVDYVLGVWKDEMEVEFVRIYEILGRDQDF